jgi:hypothetical protein
MKNTSTTVKTIGTGVRKEACVVDNLVKFTPLPHQEAIKNYFFTFTPPRIASLSSFGQWKNLHQYNNSRRNDKKKGY